MLPKIAQTLGPVFGFVSRNMKSLKSQRLTACAETPESGVGRFMKRPLLLFFRNYVRVTCVSRVDVISFQRGSLDLRTARSI